jgi:hypothetical protein
MCRNDQTRHEVFKYEESLQILWTSHSYIYIYIIYWDLDSIIYTKSRKFGEKREP